MFRSCLKTTVRKLIKDKKYTLINLVGLSSGLMLFLVIVLFVQRELDTDKHHEDWNSIFRVNSAYSDQDGGTDIYASSFQPLSAALKSDIPEVEASVYFFSPAAQLSFRSGDELLSIPNDKMLYTNNDFFDVFSVEWSNRGNRLNDPNTAVISEELAIRFFGNEEPIGKTLIYEDRTQTISLSVSGVFKKPETQSHFDYQMLINQDSKINFWKGYIENNWNMLFVYTYFKTTTGVEASQLNEKLAEIKSKYQANNDRFTYQVQALDDLYWHPVLFEPGQNGNLAYVYVFGSLAGIVLMLAAVNFINLMTARSIRRSKEIGIRKVVGASRSTIIFQHLLEAIVLASISMIVAGTTVERILPTINNNFGLSLSFNLFSNPLLLGTIIFSPLILGFLSGIYPAVAMASYKASGILGNKKVATFSHRNLRKGLLVFQFLISVIVISGVLIIQRQMAYVKNSGLGFGDDPIIVLSRINNNSNFLIRQALEGEPNIQGIASLSSIPGYRDPRARNVKENGDVGDGIFCNGIWASEDYADIIDLEFIQGRNFEITDEENTVLLNQKAATDLGWPEEEAIGKNIVMTGRNGFDPTTYRVIGVVEDYHYKSMYEEIEPLFIKNNSKSRNGGDASIVKISKKGFDQTMSKIQTVWEEIEKSDAFDYYFLDDAMNKVYQKELKLSNTVNYVAFISILVCFLGLYGLVSLTLESRKKEIGIRKVLGASESLIALLLSSSYSKVIATSIIIGLPISYYFLNKWLSGFTYRIDYSFVIYFLIGLGLLAISLVLVSAQSIYASRKNPVQSLREE